MRGNSEKESQETREQVEVAQEMKNCRYMPLCVISWRTSRVSVDPLPREGATKGAYN